MMLYSALIVDEIRERDDGSVDLIGLREDLYFDELPVVLERLTLFLETGLETADLGVRHQIDLRIVDPAGQTLVATPVRFTLPPEYPRPTAPLDPTLFEITFRQFGPHAVEIGIGGSLVRRIPLNVLPNIIEDEP